MNRTKIELTPEDARLFRWFREYQHIWEQVFKIRSGKAVLYFNDKGILMEAHGDNVIFKRKKLDKVVGLD